MSAVHSTGTETFPIFLICFSVNASYSIDSAERRKISVELDVKAVARPSVSRKLESIDIRPRGKELSGN